MTAVRSAKTPISEKNCVLRVGTMTRQCDLEFYGVVSHTAPLVQADYRRHLARVVTDRALIEAAQGAGHGVPR